MEMNSDLYANYNHQRYAHYRNVKTGGYEKETVRSAKSGTRLKPIMKQIKVSFDEVKELSLDRVGSLAPNLDTEDFTIVSNYLVDFWGAVMGDSVVSTYLHLKRHAYGKKDYCYIDIDLIAMKMGKSKNAVKGYMATLEEHGFIAIFLRRDTEDQNRDVSPLFKIRRYIPLITKEMYDGLHVKIQKLHDEFMAQFEGVNLSTSLPSTDDIIEGIVEQGEVINSKEVQEKIDNIARDGQIKEYILNKMSFEQRSEDQMIHDVFQTKLSRPSYDTWIKNAIFMKIDEFNIQVLANNKFTQEWLESRYVAMTKDVAHEVLSFNKVLGEVKVVLMEDYLSNQRSSVV